MAAEMLTPSASVRSAQHVGRAADGAMRANGRAARNARAACRSVVPDVDVMRDLNQVVQLDAITNSGILQSTPVNAGIGTDFNVVANANRTQLFDFPRVPAFGAKPKPSAPMTTPGCSRQRSPMMQSSPTVTRDLSSVSAPMRAPRSTTHKAPMRASG